MPDHLVDRSPGSGGGIYLIFSGSSASCDQSRLIHPQNRERCTSKCYRDLTSIGAECHGTRGVHHCPWKCRLFDDGIWTQALPTNHSIVKRGSSDEPVI